MGALFGETGLSIQAWKYCSRLYLLLLLLQIASLSIGKEVCICLSAWWYGSKQLWKAPEGQKPNSVSSDCFADSLPLVWSLHICFCVLPAFFFKGSLSTLLTIPQYVLLALPHKWQCHLCSQLQILLCKWQLWSLYWTPDPHTNHLLHTWLELPSQCLKQAVCSKWTPTPTHPPYFPYLN